MKQPPARNPESSSNPNPTPNPNHNTVHPPDHMDHVCSHHKIEVQQRIKTLMMLKEEIEQILCLSKVENDPRNIIELLRLTTELANRYLHKLNRWSKKDPTPKQTTSPPPALLKSLNVAKSWELIRTNILSDPQGAQWYYTRIQWLAILEEAKYREDEEVLRIARAFFAH